MEEKMDISEASSLGAGFRGLSREEVAARQRQYGPNAVPEEAPAAWRNVLGKFWGPIPWLLEATLVLELGFGRYVQAAIILFLLVFNAVISFRQESRSQQALQQLRQRLALYVRVLREGTWQQVPAKELVPGDIVHLRLGDIVPADIRLQEGELLVDASALTGESVPRDAPAGSLVHAGGVVRRGEATGEVLATGNRTAYGKTVELVQLAAPPSQLQKMIFSLVSYLMALDLILVVLLLLYALYASLPWQDMLPFALILLVASVPVALPATYTLATALAAQELTRQGVLVTRLSTIEEAAAMDILCSDKTGTLTRNELVVAALRAYSPFTEKDLLRLAVATCEAMSPDPIDRAILAAAQSQHGVVPLEKRLRFIPFDPAHKRAEAWIQDGEHIWKVIKGAPGITDLVSEKPTGWTADMAFLAAQGYRILAVLAGPEERLQLVGLLGLQDPPREEAAAVVQQLQTLGIRVLMVTGDHALTAQTVARQIGLGDRVHTRQAPAAAPSFSLDADVFAEMLPEDKYHLVVALQQQGHVVGMTGDGVNDAPALRQAEVGIAVANACDVAKAAASLVLTRAGLGDVIPAVITGRCVYQRLLTYTLNKIVKTLQVALFLTGGVLSTGQFVTTPRLILFLLFANDFVTISLASDRVAFSRRPERWHLRSLVGSGLALAGAWLIFSFGVLYGRKVWQLDWPQVQTLVFVLLVFSGQATVYLVRVRGPFWTQLPGRWLALSSLADILGVSLLAHYGIGMAPLGSGVLLSLLGATLAFFLLLDALKGYLFRYFKI
jgi:H+-transporting ATPase